MKSEGVRPSGPPQGHIDIEIVDERFTVNAPGPSLRHHLQICHDSFFQRVNAQNFQTVQIIKLGRGIFAQM